MKILLKRLLILLILCVVGSLVGTLIGDMVRTERYYKQYALTTERLQTIDNICPDFQETEEGKHIRTIFTIGSEVIDCDKVKVRFIEPKLGAKFAL